MLSPFIFGFPKKFPTFTFCFRSVLTQFHYLVRELFLVRTTRIFGDHAARFVSGDGCNLRICCPEFSKF